VCATIQFLLQNPFSQPWRGGTAVSVSPFQGLISLAPTQGFGRFASFALGFVALRFQRL